MVKDNLGVRIDGDIQLVAGFSMGGACALFHGVDRPEVFSHVYAYAGAFSASERIGDPYAQQRTIDMLIPTEKEHNRVWGMKNSEIRNRYSPETIVNTASVIRPMLPDIRIVVGRSDFTRILEMNRQMHDLLMEHDIEHEYFEVEGNHNMDFAAITLADWLNIILAPGD
mgnify:FL=1